jgi:hypothetical protein
MDKMAHNDLGNNISNRPKADYRTKFAIRKVQIRFNFWEAWNPRHDLKAKNEKKGFE